MRETNLLLLMTKIELIFIASNIPRNLATSVELYSQNIRTYALLLCSAEGMAQNLHELEHSNNQTLLKRCQYRKNLLYRINNSVDIKELRFSFGLFLTETPQIIDTNVLVLK